LDRFLRETAAQAASAFRSQTCVLVNTSDRAAVLGFYTLAYHEYRDGEMDAVTARALKVGNLKRMPTILLGQLAVARDWHGRGLGPMLLDHALRKSLMIGCTIGGVAVITDPIDDDAARFYGKYGFVVFPGETRMLLPMKTLRAVYPEVVRAARRGASAGFAPSR
jgi:GNAT superfamily N-acetyltransferase